MIHVRRDRKFSYLWADLDEDEGIKMDPPEKPGENHAEMETTEKDSNVPPSTSTEKDYREDREVNTSTESSSPLHDMNDILPDAASNAQIMDEKFILIEKDINLLKKNLLLNRRRILDTQRQSK